MYFAIVIQDVDIVRISSLSQLILYALAGLFVDNAGSFLAVPGRQVKDKVALNGKYLALEWYRQGSYREIQ
ncbi:MAG: hypothetical protein ACYC0N_00130 [Carboxydocellales bacterium]